MHVGKSSMSKISLFELAVKSNIADEQKDACQTAWSKCHFTNEMGSKPGGGGGGGGGRGGGCLDLNQLELSLKQHLFRGTFNQCFIFSMQEISVFFPTFFMWKRFIQTRVLTFVST